MLHPLTQEYDDDQMMLMLMVLTMLMMMILMMMMMMSNPMLQNDGDDNRLATFDNDHNFTKNDRQTTTSFYVMSLMDMMMKLSNTYLVMTWVMVCPLVVYHYTPLYIHNPTYMLNNFRGDFTKWVLSYNFKTKNWTLGNDHVNMYKNQIFVFWPDFYKLLIERLNQM